MRVNAGFIIVLLMCCIGFSACVDNGVDITGRITVKKAVADRKKGRITEKTGVVKIPLTAAENNLKGKVHTVRIREYKVAEGNKKTFTDSSYNVYDTAGHLVEQNGWNKNGKRTYRCIYTYEQGRLIAWNLDLIANKSKDTTVFFYDARGNKVRAVTRSSDIMASGRKEYTYDEMGNETEIRAYGIRGQLRTHMQSKYDGAGNQLIEADLFPDGTVYKATRAEYDMYGNATLRVYYEGGQITSRTMLRNDANGKHIEIRLMRPDSTLEAREEYAYDTMGNMVEHRHFVLPELEKEAYRIVFEYEYDSMGNITHMQAVPVVDGKRGIVKVIEYLYTYYP